MMNSGFALFALSFNNFSALKEAPQSCFQLDEAKGIIFLQKKAF
jgi:hypothetical protein